MKNKFPTKEIIDLINTGTTEKKKENDGKITEKISLTAKQKTEK